MYAITIDNSINKTQFDRNYKIELPSKSFTNVKCMFTCLHNATLTKSRLQILMVIVINHDPHYITRKS